MSKQSELSSVVSPRGGKIRKLFDDDHVESSPSLTSEDIRSEAGTTNSKSIAVSSYLPELYNTSKKNILSSSVHNDVVYPSGPTSEHSKGTSLVPQCAEVEAQRNPPMNPQGNTHTAEDVTMPSHHTSQAHGNDLIDDKSNASDMHDTGDLFSDLASTLTSINSKHRAASGYLPSLYEKSLGNIDEPLGNDQGKGESNYQSGLLKSEASSEPSLLSVLTSSHHSHLATNETIDEGNVAENEEAEKVEGKEKNKFTEEHNEKELGIEESKQSTAEAGPSPQVTFSLSPERFKLAVQACTLSPVPYHNAYGSSESVLSRLLASPRPQSEGRRLRREKTGKGKRETFSADPSFSGVSSRRLASREHQRLPSPNKKQVSISMETADKMVQNIRTRQKVEKASLKLSNGTHFCAEPLPIGKVKPSRSQSEAAKSHSTNHPTVDSSEKPLVVEVLPSPDELPKSLRWCASLGSRPCAIWETAVKTFLVESKPQTPKIKEKIG